MFKLSCIFLSFVLATNEDVSTAMRVHSPILSDVEMNQRLAEIDLEIEL